MSLDAVPLWAFFGIAAVLALLGLDGGYRIGRWRHAHVAEEKDGPVGAMVGSILGLLALMLAFAFNLAASRFDARRMTVLEEANAIGTTFLRTRLLPEPHRTETARLLREYVNIRLQSVQNGTPAEGIARSEEIHNQLWAHAMTAAEESRNAVTTALFIQSLNEVIDLHAKRVLIGLRSRMPSMIWIALFALALLGMLATGYQAGIMATRRTPAMVLLAVCFAGVLYLIVDLDRGVEGLLQVDQQSLIDLQAGMKTP